jgi:hypothetical protein
VLEFTRVQTMQFTGNRAVEQAALDIEGCLMRSAPYPKQSTWEFVKRQNGSYAVFRNGELLADSIPEKWRESEFCSFGFCGQEYREIVDQLEVSGKCTLVL